MKCEKFKYTKFFFIKIGQQLSAIMSIEDKKILRNKKFRSNNKVKRWSRFTTFEVYN